MTNTYGSFHRKSLGSGTADSTTYLRGDGQWGVVTGASGSATSVTVVTDTFTGNGTTTVFTLSNSSGSTANSWVVVSGLLQSKSSYSISGTTLTFTESPPNTSNVECTYINLAAGSLFSNVQTFTSSGTFTVPAGISILTIFATGGGGGGGGNSYVGGTGGTTSFGSYVIAPGGGGGAQQYFSSTSGPGTQAGYINGSGVMGIGIPYSASGQTAGQPTIYGAGGNPGGGAAGIQGGRGDNGSQTFAMVPVTSGQTITVTIGAGGSAGDGAGVGQKGGVIVRW